MRRNRTTGSRIRAKLSRARPDSAHSGPKFGESRGPTQVEIDPKSVGIEFRASVAEFRRLPPVAYMSNLSEPNRSRRELIEVRPHSARNRANVGQRGPNKAEVGPMLAQVHRIRPWFRQIWAQSSPAFGGFGRFGPESAGDIYLHHDNLRGLSSWKDHWQTQRIVWARSGGSTLWAPSEGRRGGSHKSDWRCGASRHSLRSWLSWLGFVRTQVPPAPILPGESRWSRAAVRGTRCLVQICMLGAASARNSGRILPSGLGPLPWDPHPVDLSCGDSWS